MESSHPNIRKVELLNQFDFCGGPSADLMRSRISRLLSKSHPRLLPSRARQFSDRSDGQDHYSYVVLKDRPIIARRTFLHESAPSRLAPVTSVARPAMPKVRPVPPAGTAFEMAWQGDLSALGGRPSSELREIDHTTGNSTLLWAAEGGSVETVAMLLRLDPPLDRNAKCNISGIHQTSQP